MAAVGWPTAVFGIGLPVTGTETGCHMKSTGQLVRVTDITPYQRNEMFALMDGYYEQVTRSAFEADLDEKQWGILLLEEGTGRVLGFSTQLILQLRVDDRPIRALFSGDTIIDRNAWGQQNLFQISGWLLRWMIDTYPHDELYWYLISKGYKTYRFLPLFFHEYYPCYDEATPAQIAAVIDALSLSRFPDNYDREAGIVKANEKSGCRLRPGVADITTERLRDPHIRFFDNRNPGHARGDELCCIAPLSLTNFTRVAYRAMGPHPPTEMALS